MPTPGIESGAPYAFREYTGDGSNRIFPIAFPYLDRDHIKLYVNDVATTAFTFLSDTSIQTTAAPADEATVLVRRDTPVTSLLVTFSNGAALKGTDLNTANRQALYVVQEAVDSALTAVALSNAAIAAAGAAAASATEAAASATEALETLELTQAAASALLLTYDITLSSPVLPLSGQNIGVYVVSRALSLASGTGSGRIALAAVGSVNLTMDLKKNGSTIGSASVIAGQTAGTVTIDATTALAAGDRLTIESTTSDPAAAPSGFSLVLNASRV